jgi:DNA polymerase-1
VRCLGAERAAINVPVQGHDELVFEVPESEVAWGDTEVPRLMVEEA